MVRLGYAVPIDKPPATVIIANGNDFSSLSPEDLEALTSWGYFNDSQLTVNNGAPYVDPTTGQKMQPKLTVEAAPNGAVRVTSTDQPVDEAGNPTKNEDGTDKKPEDSKDPCAENPDLLTCAALGTLDPSGDPSPTTHSLTFTPGTLATAGSCPAPRTFTAAGRIIEMSYQPICDAVSTYVQPLVLLASAVASFFIFVGGIRT